MAAHQAHNLKVASSSLAPASIKIRKTFTAISKKITANWLLLNVLYSMSCILWAYSSAGRAPALQAGGRKFESC